MLFVSLVLFFAHFSGYTPVLTTRTPDSFCNQSEKCILPLPKIESVYSSPLEFSLWWSFFI